MKRILTGICLLFSIIASAQNNFSKGIYEFKNKLHLYYVDTRGEQVFVYGMGGYYDKAGSGYAISWTDTLTKQADVRYQGRKSWMVVENDKLYLVVTGKKEKKRLLTAVPDLARAYTNLNNAHYLRHYFKLSDELNKKYKLNHHSFRNAYFTWDSLANKDMEYLAFRRFADERLQRIMDSISREQDRYVATSNYIIENLSTLKYDRLKDSLLTLPVDYMPESAYHGTVICAIAKQQPHYFFKLAEEFPAWRTLMYFAVDRDKDAMATLRSVEGYAEMKRAVLGRK